ncbi:hypothetical protein JW968_06315 [Candidatus Woesearchaeota archaeon]|nr:hypothetical protein [Candidatus Woesearchaeota archaeon]
MFDIIIGRNASDREKYGMKGTILIAKHYVKMGQTTSLSNKIYMDISRTHVVFICGKRGGGKCVTGDTLVTLNDGRTVPIHELKNNDNEILALNEDLKITKKAKDEFFERTVNKILKIRLRTGKEIKLTPEHPLLTINGWTEAKDLGAGSRIATPRGMDVFGEKDISEHQAKLLAYLIAEGHLGNGFVLFSNKDPEIVDDFKRAVHDLDPSLEIKSHGENNYRIVGYEKRKCKAKRDEKGKFMAGSCFDSKSSMRKWIERAGLYEKDSRTKFIPEDIFTAPKNKVSLFLNRLFSCDGSIYKSDDYRISYSSASERIIKQVHHLLLRFGVLNRIRDKNNKNFISYEIEIKGQNVSKFLQDIGFFGRKGRIQEKALLECKTRNPNLDTIPKEIWDRYRPENWAAIGKVIGYSTPKALRSSIEYAPSRQKLLQIAELDGNEFIQRMAESDIYWDEIASVEEMMGEFKVYDISVPEAHNFVANDIIIHNSYTMGVIAEGLSDMPEEVRQNISIILLDTMGVYWTMKYPNKKDEDLLREWNKKPVGLNPIIFTPDQYYYQYKDEGIPTDFPFSIKPSDLDIDDWLMTFGLTNIDPIGVLLTRHVLQLKKDKGDFSIQDIIDAVMRDERGEKQTKDALENLLLGTMNWGVFSEKGTPIKDLARGGQVTVLDLSCYATMPGGWSIKALVLGIISKKLFIERMVARKKEEFDQIHTTMHYFGEEDISKKAQEMPMVWLVIDEAHEFLPVTGKTAATDALVTILREGRQPGISLILASQQPGKIHTDVMTQSDTVIAHRITAKLDVEALGMLMQSYMREGLTILLDNLPRVKGAAIIFDDTNEKMYAMRVRPRFTWHGGEAPMAVKKSKTLFEDEVKK